ncbi:MAG: Cof-type HAD-IIB family hydrolase [Bacteroidales bacterium]|jgi:Cof subfamily protein (haloacid dehalogenase superfamily)|nr:Cof-type HAD-IIB family hydrolase [Bacteroidales bacterium]
MKNTVTNRKPAIKALFFDIDGTLVSFRSHTVPPSAVGAIRQAQEKGIRAFIATGRSAFQIPDLGGLHFDGYITQNGVYCITDTEEVILKNPVPQEDIEALLRYLDEKMLFPCSLMTGDEIAINYISPKVEALSKMVNVPLPQVKDLRKVAEKEVFQVNVYVNEEQEKVLMREVFVHCEPSRWNPLFADINAAGFSKRTGIDKFLEHYHFHPEETMAFGDGGNDIAMLKHVGIGVAMGNAMEEVKAVADYVTSPVDDDGIRNALQYCGII